MQQSMWLAPALLFSSAGLFVLCCAISRWREAQRLSLQKRASAVTQPMVLRKNGSRRPQKEAWEIARDTGMLARINSYGRTGYPVYYSTEEDIDPAMWRGRQ